MATYQYQQNMSEGAAEGYIKYNITPAFGTRLTAGDTFRISGKVYARDFDIYGIGAFGAISAGSATPPIGTVSGYAKKGVATNFVLTGTITELLCSLGAERVFDAYLILSVFDNEDFSSGTSLRPNSNQMFNLLKGHEPPVISSAQIGDETGGYERFGGFIYNKSEITVSGNYALDPYDTQAIPESVHLQIGDTVVTAKEVSFTGESFTAKFGVLSSLVFGSYPDFIVSLTDSRGSTGVYTGGGFTVFDYSPVFLMAYPSMPVFQRYSVSEDDGNETTQPDAAGVYVWCSFAGDVYGLNGQNPWRLEAGYALPGEEIVFNVVKSGTGDMIFDIERDETIFPRTTEFSASQRYNLALRLTDYFGSTTLSYSIEKGGGYFSIGKYGVSVGKRSSGSAYNRKIEVDPDYTLYYEGNGYDGDGNKIIGKAEWKTLDINENVNESTAIYTKYGQYVNIQGGVYLKNTLAPNTTLTIATLPEKYRPKENVYFPAMLGGGLYRVSVTAEGNVNIIHYNSNSLSNAYLVSLPVGFIAGN